MKATRLVPLALALGVVAAACTGKASGAGSQTPSVPRTTTPAGTASAPPGTAVYVYRNAGLTATLDLDGNAGTLEIDNQTGRELSPPGFYLLDARDGHRVDGHVDGATTTPNGRTAEFDVGFAGLEVKNIGLAVLLIGADNYGAFVRQ